MFVDECFMNGQLRRYFKMICSVASKNETLLNPHPSQEDFGIVMEAICNHFILSFSDKQAFEDFLSRLFSAHAEESRYSFVAPALSVSTAVSLLFCPIMISGPKYMQAHLIFMVSRATQAVMKIESLKPDRKLVNCFLAIFEKSVSLYKSHMSYLQKDGDSTSSSEYATSGTSDETTHLPFDFLISLDTKKRFDSLLAKLNHASNQRLRNRFSKMKSELVCSSIRVVKEFQNVYDISCHDDILAILTCLIHQVSGSFDEITRYSMKAMTMQDIYLLASLLKLMGTSLLGVIWCLRNNNDLCFLNTLKDFSSSKEYDFILGAVTCFRDFPIDLPLQQYLSNVLSCHSEGSKDSKMMFLHFSGLMSLSFVCGLDCLVKGSLFTILALLNLFIFEEGGLDALNKMVKSTTGSLPSGFPVVRIHEVAAALFFLWAFICNLCMVSNVQFFNDAADHGGSKLQHRSCIKVSEDTVIIFTVNDIDLHAICCSDVLEVCSSRKPFFSYNIMRSICKMSLCAGHQEILLQPPQLLSQTKF